MPIGTAAFEDRRYDYSRDLYTLLAGCYLRQVSHLLPPDARGATPRHPRSRITAHRIEWAIVDSRDED